MVALRGLKIDNYKSCICTTVSLETNLTTLIGLNGVGKTNILHSLNLLPKVRGKGGFYELELFPHLRQTTLELRFDIKSEIYDLKVTIYCDPNDTNFEEFYNTELFYKNVSEGDADWNEISFELYDILRYKPTKIIEKVFFEKVAQGSETAAELSCLFQIFSFIKNISYYSATRFADPSRCPLSIEIDEKFWYRNMRNLTALEQFLYDLYLTSLTKTSDYQLYLNTVNKLGIGLIDDIHFFSYKIPSTSLIVSPGGKVEPIENVKTIVVPSFEIDQLTFSPNQLSEGTFKALALVFYILNDDCKLLMIEEPEVCVHRGLLNSIMELIIDQSSRKQIIISTHSDYVLGRLKPENVILVTKPKNQGTSAETLPSYLSDDDFNVLKEYLKSSGNLGEYWKETGFAND